MLSHEELHRAISSHDSEQAELAMREHIGNSRGMIQSLF